MGQAGQAGGAIQSRKDRRREPRFAADAKVQITLLGSDRNTPIQARVLDMSGKGLRVVLTVPLPSGALVKVEGIDRRDMLLACEVMYTNVIDGERQVGLAIDHALYSRSDGTNKTLEPAGAESR